MIIEKWMAKLSFGISMALLASAAFGVEVKIGYISQTPEEISVLSELETRPDDLGYAGALLAQEGNNTTGKFLGHSYVLDARQDLSPEDAIVAAVEFLDSGVDLLTLSVDAQTALKIAELEVAQNALIFNARAEDNALRGEYCKRNMLHTIPSLAMRTDAIVQFLKYRKWDDLALVVGEHPQDLQYGDALIASLIKFGIDTPARLEWVYDADMRRSAFMEGPLFSQVISKKDVILVADEIHDFARYLMYNTWAPQIMAGSEGLQSEAWAGVVEQWGAVQLQNRFVEIAGREMQSEDYAVWAAVRAVGEAVTRLNKADASSVRNFLMSEEFELAGFKGQPLSFRAWNGQMRQPMPIFHERALVALAPLEGYLHQFSELDTLGSDVSENQCQEFEE